MRNTSFLFLPLALSAVFLLILIVSILAFTGPSGVVEAQNGDMEPTVWSSTRSPAAVASYEVTFTTPSQLESLTDVINMELHEDIRVPRGINPATVRVHSRNGNDGIVDEPAQLPC